MKPKQKPQPDEFWKIAELRKLMNLCDNEMETSTMPLKLRYEGEIKLMQQAEAFGRADERAKTQLEDNHMKSEAVKWIEHYDVEAERGSPVAIALSAWLNHFFNITDEDLK